MIQTDEQRRWWFAVHPEYSWSRRGARNRSHEDEIEVQPAYLSEDIEAYVNEGLKYFPDGPVAALLKGLKWGLDQKDGLNPSAFTLSAENLDKAQPEPENESEKEKKASESVFDDAFLQGLQNSLENVFGSAFSASSRKLRRNMEMDGKTIPPGHAGHHIVPTSDNRFRPENEEARKILYKFNIPLNSSHNGVALPYTRGIGEGAYHPGIHTREYYKQALKALGRAKTRDQAIQILEKIGDKLSKGKFPE